MLGVSGSSGVTGASGSSGTTGVSGSDGVSLAQPTNNIKLIKNNSIFFISFTFYYSTSSFKIK